MHSDPGHPAGLCPPALVRCFTDRSSSVHAMTLQRLEVGGSELGSVIIASGIRPPAPQRAQSHKAGCSANALESQQPHVDFSRTHREVTLVLCSLADAAAAAGLAAGLRGRVTEVQYGADGLLQRALDAADAAPPPLEDVPGHM